VVETFGRPRRLPDVTTVLTARERAVKAHDVVRAVLLGRTTA